MNDRLFKRLIELLLDHAEQQRDTARASNDSTTGDGWSAISGLLDNIRQRFRK